MSDALYERYKDALRRGHVAAGRGRHNVALEAYGEASRLAPDRALPYVAIAGVMAGRGRHAEALAAFDAALERAPADEAALRGRAELLASTGDRAEAARSFDRLAMALDGAGRVADATDAARRALELAESRGRRDAVSQLADRLRAGSDDPATSEAIASVERLLGGPVVRDSVAAGVAPGEGLPTTGIEEAVARSETNAPLAPAPGVGSGPGPKPETEAADRAEPVPVTGAAPDPGPEPAPEPPAPPVAPFEPGPATARVEDAADAGDVETTLALALEAAAGHRAGGRGVAAIDVCYLALATNPAAPALHLALGEIYLDRGWRPVAADKLALLARLADLTDDAATRARVCEVAATRLPEDARLAAVCA